MTVIYNNRLWVKLTSCCNMGGPSISWRSEEKDLWGFPKHSQIPPQLKTTASPKTVILPGQLYIMKGQWRWKSTSLGHLCRAIYPGLPGDVNLDCIPASSPARFWPTLSPLHNFTQKHVLPAYLHHRLIPDFLIYEKKSCFFFPNEDDRHVGKVGKL